MRDTDHFVLNLDVFVYGTSFNHVTVFLSKNGRTGCGVRAAYEPVSVFLGAFRLDLHAHHGHDNHFLAIGPERDH